MDLSESDQNLLGVVQMTPWRGRSLRTLMVGAVGVPWAAWLGGLVGLVLWSGLVVGVAWLLIRWGKNAWNPQEWVRVDRMVNCVWNPKKGESPERAAFLVDGVPCIHPSRWNPSTAPQGTRVELGWLEREGDVRTPRILVAIGQEPVGLAEYGENASPVGMLRLSKLRLAWLLVATFLLVTALLMFEHGYVPGTLVKNPLAAWKRQEVATIRELVSGDWVGREISVTGKVWEWGEPRSQQQRLSRFSAPVTRVFRGFVDAPTAAQLGATESLLTTLRCDLPAAPGKAMEQYHQCKEFFTPQMLRKNEYRTWLAGLHVPEIPSLWVRHLRVISVPMQHPPGSWDSLDANKMEAWLAGRTQVSLHGILVRDSGGDLVLLQGKSLTPWGVFALWYCFAFAVVASVISLGPAIRQRSA